MVTALRDNERARVATPALPKIADAWMDLDPNEIQATFPNLPVLMTGWGDASCFRCGWIVPDRTWSSAGGWLEKAHLHDHRHGGSSEPLNLVPLCPLCHEQQPECFMREDGIAFVNTESEYRPLLWIAQAVTDHAYRGVTGQGRDCLHKLMRAYAKAGVILASTMREKLR